MLAVDRSAMVPALDRLVMTVMEMNEAPGSPSVARDPVADEDLWDPWESPEPSGSFAQGLAVCDGWRANTDPSSEDESIKGQSKPMEAALMVPASPPDSTHKAAGGMSPCDACSGSALAEEHGRGGGGPCQ